MHNATVYKTCNTRNSGNNRLFWRLNCSWIDDHSNNSKIDRPNEWRIYVLYLNDWMDEKVKIKFQMTKADDDVHRRGKNANKSQLEYPCVRAMTVHAHLKRDNKN